MNICSENNVLSKVMSRYASLQPQAAFLSPTTSGGVLLRSRASLTIPDNQSVKLVRFKHLVWLETYFELCRLHAFKPLSPFLSLLCLSLSLSLSLSLCLSLQKDRISVHASFVPAGGGQVYRGKKCNKKLRNKQLSYTSNLGKGTRSDESSGCKTLSRNVVLVESVSTPYSIISGTIPGVQT